LDLEQFFTYQYGVYLVYNSISLQVPTSCLPVQIKKVWKLSCQTTVV